MHRVEYKELDVEFDFFFSIKPAALSSSLELMVEIQRSTSSLVSAGGNLQDALSAARQNITSARRSCTSDGAGSACNVIPAEEGLTTEANFTKVI